MILAGTDRSGFLLAVVHQGEKIRLVHHIEEVDVLRFAGAVNDDIEIVSVLGFHSDELLVFQHLFVLDNVAFILKDVVNERHIAGRGQRSAADHGKKTGKEIVDLFGVYIPGDSRLAAVAGRIGHGFRGNADFVDGAGSGGNAVLVGLVTGSVACIRGNRKRHEAAQYGKHHGEKPCFILLQGFFPPFL